MSDHTMIEWHPRGTAGPWKVDEKRDISTESGVMVAVCYQWASPVDLAAAAEVPFFFKQWGEWRPTIEGDSFDTGKGNAQRFPAFLISQDGTVHCFMRDAGDSDPVVIRVGKKAAGRLLDGVEHNGFPEAAHA